MVSGAAAAADGPIVVCESWGNAYRECRVGSTGTIQLVTEYSENLCVEDVTWGWNKVGVVWVRRNCRASFRIGPGAELKPWQRRTTVVCESHNGNHEVCNADVSRGVTLMRQLSQSKCEFGTTWGFESDRELIWVDRGCRAAFHLGKGTDAGAAEVLDAPVTCESKNGKRSACKADTAGGVQLVRQLDKDPCNYGKDWGWDADGIWVDHGCRAEFAVRGKPKVMLQAIACESDGTRVQCPADTRYGVAVFRTTSERECILDETWGFDANGVWVDKGCRAQFAVGGYRLPVETLPPNAEKVTCESLDGGHKPCPVDTSRGVGLLKQISDADCVLNKTWGYNREGIWVTNGCRADFAVAH